MNKLITIVASLCIGRRLERAISSNGKDSNNLFIQQDFRRKIFKISPFFTTVFTIVKCADIIIYLTWQ